MPPIELKTIRIRAATKAELVERMGPQESYDTVIRRLLDGAPTNRKRGRQRPSRESPA